MILSIIIPVYNVQDYLERCIDSVANRCSDDVEIILVDDGSTDNCSNICDQYATNSKNISVIHKKNGGLSDARNVGLKYANGEYLAFLDSDDMFEDSFVKDIIKVIRKYKSDIISFNWCAERKKNTYNVNGDKKLIYFNRWEYLRNICDNHFGNQICFRIYKKKLFENILFPIGCHYEDIQTLWKLVSNANNIIHINFTYYIYNLTNEFSITKNTSFTSMMDMKNSVDAMIYGISNIFMKEGKLDYEMEEIISYYKLDTYVYICYKLKNKNNERKEKQDIIQYITSHKVRFWRYRRYNWKKYIVVRVLCFLKKI